MAKFLNEQTTPEPRSGTVDAFQLEPSYDRKDLADRSDLCVAEPSEFPLFFLAAFHFIRDPSAGLSDILIL